MMTSYCLTDTMFARSCPHPTLLLRLPRLVLQMRPTRLVTPTLSLPLPPSFTLQLCCTLLCVFAGTQQSRCTLLCTFAGSTHYSRMPHFFAVPFITLMCMLCARLPLDSFSRNELMIRNPYRCPHNIHALLSQLTSEMPRGMRFFTLS
jgi:hypothetical protein